MNKRLHERAARAGRTGCPRSEGGAFMNRKLLSALRALGGQDVRAPEEGLG